MLDTVGWFRAFAQKMDENKLKTGPLNSFAEQQYSGDLNTGLVCYSNSQN